MPDQLQKLGKPGGTALMAVLVMSVATVGATEPPDYRADIKPVLAEKCFACHGALQQEAGLRLDAIRLIRQGGESGAALKPGSAGESLIIQRVSSTDPDLRMPPADAGHPLTEQQIALLKSWIAAGAVAPEEPIPADPREHWAFQPPLKSAVPAIDAPWIRNDLDRFLAAEHQRLGLVAVGEAPRSLLLRRVYLDLIGLPPTHSELQRFLDDQSPDAWQNAVDQLLDSPRYGERWARHFMDIWRYSDPSGYGDEIRDGRRHIWRWRDWIVESLNADKGYDRLVVEMLAADEAAPDDLDAARATGFLARNWYKFNRNVWLDNIVEHTSKAFLGMTLNCARCHDHKYDPVGQNEYYQLRAFFEPHDVRDDPLAPNNSDLLVRAFDAQAITPTYLFRQGDENRPDEAHPLAPGTPAALGGDLAIAPIKLPATAYYPALRPENRQVALARADADIQLARSAVAEADKAVQAATLALAQESATKPVGTSATTDRQAAPPGDTKPVDAKPADAKPGDAKPADAKQQAPQVILADEFAELDPTRWTVESGQWEIRAGRLVQRRGETVQHRLVSVVEHPRDFRARLKLRITGGEMWRSVGLGFDVQGKSMQAIYLSAFAGGSKAQVTLQDEAGSWVYPTAGAVPREVRLDQDYAVEIVVRDRLLNILIDDTLQVAFTLPARRGPGKLSIFTFSATAEFDDLHVETLAADAPLVADSADQPLMAAAPRSPAVVMDEANAVVEVARKKLALAEAERASLAARIAAEMVKYDLSAGDARMLGEAAGHASRLATVCNYEHQIAVAEHALAKAAGQPAGDAKARQAAEQAGKNLEAQTKQLADARRQLENGSSEYPAVGPLYPATSTGRRLALARWIVDRRNPLTARVLVNHVWLRHFDAPLVERMFDFGLRSARPQHAELLDWLAVQFMEDGWSLKKLHRQIVLSGAYRLSSSPAVSPPAAVAIGQSNRRIDPDNQALWRMNARRMEAEAARDSVLFLGGSLDPTMGGPPIGHDQGQTVWRRSLYFRQDKERQMTFLSLFDGAKVNECYRRKATVAPQQALAMFNSRIAWEQAGKLADQRAAESDAVFVAGLFEHVLCRPASTAEMDECQAFLAEAGADQRQDARRQLALVLLNHNDFVTIR